MARTINELYDAIIAEKEGRSTLDGLSPSADTSAQFLEDLNSDSKVAIWRLWAYITAVSIHTLEILWDLFKADVERIAAAAPAGTPGWYHKKVLEYQHGDVLVYIDQQYKYQEIDPSAKIVAQCAIEERSNGTLVIKVAKSSSGTLQALSADEKNGLGSYVNKIKFAGTRTSVFSSAPDTVNMNYNLYYDPIVPLADLIIAIDDALLNYSKTMPFNGALNVNQFTDVLQSVRGVKDPVFVSGTLTTGISSITFPINIEIYPPAGYIIYSGSCETMFNFIQKL